MIKRVKIKTELKYTLGGGGWKKWEIEEEMTNSQPPIDYFNAFSIFIVEINVYFRMPSISIGRLTPEPFQDKEKFDQQNTLIPTIKIHIAFNDNLGVPAQVGTFPEKENTKQNTYISTIKIYIV